jgi:phage shock protein E
MIQEISVEEFKQNSHKYCIIDVREEFEIVQDGKIPNSILIPLGDVVLDKILDVNPDKKPVLIYCRSGRRSMMACELLANETKEILFCNLKGGILSCKK